MFLLFLQWLRGKNFSTCGVSSIWRGFLQSIPWLGCHLACQVGNGVDIWIGIDPVIGVSSTFLLPEGLRSYLEDLDIKTLTQAHNTLLDSQQYWYSAEELYLDGEWKEAWNTYMRNLVLSGIRLTTQPDSMVWEYNKKMVPSQLIKYTIAL